MMLTDKKISKLTIREIILRGTVIAFVISIPSIGAFFIAEQILDDFIMAVMIGVLVHLVALVFSLKISKKFLIKEPKTDLF